MTTVNTLDGAAIDDLDDVRVAIGAAVNGLGGVLAEVASGVLHLA